VQSLPTTTASGMTPEVQAAVEEIRSAFPGHITVEAEEQGGAYVILDIVELGDTYSPSSSWIGFLITFQYPDADVYPHFIDGSVRRCDGTNHAEGVSGPTDWRGRSALQLSRRSNRWNAATDTALLKLNKVLEWFRAGCPKSR